MFKKYITVVCLALSLSGCSFLDLEEDTGTSKQDAYEFDFKNINKLVNYIYAQLPQDFGVMGGGALREAATDNAVFTWSNSSVYNIYNNAWSPIAPIDDVWENHFTVIRSANSFLENFSLDKFDRLQWSDNYKDDVKKAKRFVWEVRALRAYYYFELAKRYGDVPLLTRTYTMDEINSIQKTSFNEIIEFVVNECKEVAPQLPITQEIKPAGGNEADYGLGELGRVTRGMLLSVKARALLYAASPLHNPTNNKNKWKEAATAAYDIIGKGWYTMENITKDALYNSPNGGHDILKSKQLIYVRLNGNSKTFEENNSPIGFEGGNSGNTPTQNLIDAYEMTNGKAFDWNNAAQAANPYKDRDPRMDKTVLYNGSTFKKVKVETFEGGKNGYPIEGATLTGYYLRKYMNETVSLSPVKPDPKPHHYIMFRYGETLLNYAEAMNEWQGPDYSDGEHPMSARAAVNLVRSAANMPLITDNGEAFTKRLRNERRIELAFEDHRFWDIRRWKMGDVVKDIYGVKIKVNEGKTTYEAVKIQSRIWEDKMYLYPISQTESMINTNLGQNPGW